MPKRKRLTLNLREKNIFNLQWPPCRNRRSNTSSEEESSSSDPERKNKPYRDTATKRGLARLENEQKHLSSSFETFKEDAAARDDKIAKDITNLTHTVTDNQEETKSELGELNKTVAKNQEILNQKLEQYDTKLMEQNKSFTIAQEAFERKQEHTNSKMMEQNEKLFEAIKSLESKFGQTLEIQQLNNTVSKK